MQTLNFGAKTLAVIMLLVLVCTAGARPQFTNNLFYNQPEPQFTIDSAVGNTPQLVFYLYSAPGTAFDASGYVATFFFATSEYPADIAGGFSQTGTVSASTVTVTIASNFYATALTDGYAALKLTKSGERISFARGKQNIQVSPEINATNIATTGRVVNWADYDSYLATAASGPYRAGTSISFTSNADGSQNISWDASALVLTANLNMGGFVVTNMGAMLENLNMGGFSITNIGTNSLSFNNGESLTLTANGFVFSAALNGAGTGLTGLSGLTGLGTQVEDMVFGSDYALRRNTSDASDNGSLFMTGGGATSFIRGAYVGVYGNEEGSFPGDLHLQAGNVAGGEIRLMSGAGLTRLLVNLNGNIDVSQGMDVAGFLTVAPTGAVSLSVGSGRIAAVSDPTAAQDAATKNYVDTLHCTFAEIGVRAGSITNDLTTSFSVITNLTIFAAEGDLTVSATNVVPGTTGAYSFDLSGSMEKVGGGTDVFELHVHTNGVDTGIGWTRSVSTVSSQGSAAGGGTITNLAAGVSITFEHKVLASTEQIIYEHLRLDVTRRK